jgi:hypothetical protein
MLRNHLKPKVPRFYFVAYCVCVCVCVRACVRVWLVGWRPLPFEATDLFVSEMFHFKSEQILKSFWISFLLFILTIEDRGNSLRLILSLLLI